MRSDELRQKFLNFFEKNGHIIVPSSSLIPDDPSVLLTTAGMQQFKPYYSELDPETTVHPSIGKPIGKNAASVQKSFRTSDIDEVGDDSHLTFFEMLGNFSFGGYFKKEAIRLAHEFITKELGFPISFVTIFKGSETVAKDEESRKIWQALGVKDIREEGIEDNFWGPTGNAGPCGPTTEIYCENSSGGKAEIWNVVFNEFFFPGSRAELLSGASGKKLEKLKTPGVDTGMGLERLAMIAQNKKNIFETDLFQQPLQYFLAFGEAGRIISDHLRGSIFLLADGLRPSNKDAGYILRRLIRRIVVNCKLESIPLDSLTPRIQRIINYYDFYPGLVNNSQIIFEEFNAEVNRFNKALDKGLNEFFKKYPEMQVQRIERGKGFEPHILRCINVDDAFYFHQTFGLTVDIIKDLAKKGGHLVDEESFHKAFKQHQEISRAGQEKKFGGHGLLLDTGELKAADENELKIVTRLHTATHMLQRALREVLGPDVHQAGSDITVERTRFDFTFPRKLTPEEIRQVEDLINQKIKDDLPMQKKVLPKSEAEKTGALYFFKEKYPDPVNVYFIGKSLEDAWSKEFCGGPHVTHTGEIGKFRIAKEEAVGAGTRRIRAVVR